MPADTGQVHVPGVDIARRDHGGRVDREGHLDREAVVLQIES